MFSFISHISDRYKLLVAVLVISITSVTVFLLFSNEVNAAIIAIVILAILFITHRVWLPEGKMPIRLASLTLAGTAVLTTSVWPNLLAEIIRYFSPEAADTLASALAEATSIPILVFLFLVIFTVNYFSRDSTAMGKHETALDKDIPDPTFKEKMRGVVEALVDDLKSIDNKTNWSMSYFTSLDAEVEINTGRGREKRITDLLSAIKKSKERLFMVLGDPGSGKSVALRKLTRDLAAESEKTGKIPVYINLKEWYVEEKWTEEYPPTIEQLNDFVQRNLKSRDIVTARFFDKYYDRLYETGRLYFIFDSFDEIPSVLDETDGSFLIHQLSEILFRFLKGARLESQGLLASRIFRKPTQEFQSNITLEIRPFSEEKIIRTLKRSNIYSKELAERLFKERPELVPIAKNPFMATLVADFAENNQNRLPANQAEMYKSYIEKTLHDCRDRLERKKIDVPTVYNCCEILAQEMFGYYGLEVPIDKIRNKYPELPLDEVTDILRFARLGRGVSNDTSKFSFVHRRFAEYFYVQNMLAGNVDIQLDSIPADSQQRDALVLYCEVADFEKAKSIAEYCWSVIASINNPMDLRSIHSLRFLRDAFRGRKDCIAGFHAKLRLYILNQLTPESNLISAKLATEAIGLVNKRSMEILLTQSLKLGNPWISEHAIKSCWHMDNLSTKTQKTLYSYFKSAPIEDIFKNYYNYSFFLNLSNSFMPFYQFYRIKIIRLFFVTIIFAITLTTSPIFIPFLLFFLLITAAELVLPGIDAISNSLFKKLSIIINKVNNQINLNYFPRKKIASEILFNIFPLFLIICAIAAWSNGHIQSIDTKNESPPMFMDLSIYFGKMVLNTYFLTTSFLLLCVKIEHILIFKKNYKIFINEISLLLFIIKKIIRNLVTLLFFSIILIIIGILMTYLIVTSYTVFAIIQTITLIIIFIFFAFYIYSSINQVFKYLNDISHVEPLISRETIYKSLQSTTHSYQLRYIRQLETKVKIVTGEWPDPNFLSDKDSEAITRLAKLEEKWLGLDR